MNTTPTNQWPVAPLPDIFPGRSFLHEDGLVVIKLVLPMFDRVYYTQGRDSAYHFLDQEEFLRQFGPLHIH